MPPRKVIVEISAGVLVGVFRLLAVGGSPLALGLVVTVDRALGGSGD